MGLRSVCASCCGGSLHPKRCLDQQAAGHEHGHLARLHLPAQQLHRAVVNALLLVCEHRNCIFYAMSYVVV